MTNPDRELDVRELLKRAVLLLDQYYRVHGCGNARKLADEISASPAVAALAQHPAPSADGVTVQYWREAFNQLHTSHNFAKCIGYDAWRDLFFIIQQHAAELAALDNAKENGK
jgi:hypothetical protein